MPFEAAAMGVTGLETAFAALHTDLVLPGVIDLDLLVEKLTSGGGPSASSAPRLAAGAEANVALIDPAAELDGRRGRLREPLRQLLLRGPQADRRGC